MGDASSERACERFVKAFNADAVRILSLNLGHGAILRQYLGWNDDFEVRFYVSLSDVCMQKRLVMLPDVIFDAAWTEQGRDNESIVADVASALLLDEVYVKTTLEKAGIIR